MINKLITIILFSGLSLSALAQSNKVIKINIDNYKDTVLILTSYFGDKIRLVDTAFSKKGKFEFKNSDGYKGGIYMAVSGKKSKLFEFLVNQETKITLSTDTISYVRNMHIKGSEENKIFFDYVLFNESVYKQIKKYSDELKETKQNDKRHAELLSLVDSLNKASIDYKLNIINSKPNLFVSKMLNAMREPEIPDSIKIDTANMYEYYKNHYWDNLDLSDSRFLRTPLLNKRIVEYFGQVVPIQPDSVIVAIDNVLEKASGSPEVFNYLVWKFVGEYQNPKYMGFDKVFVHIAYKYFSTDKYEISNATESIRKSILDRAAILSPLTIGKPAPNLILIDTNGQYVSFNVIKSKYLVILFWDDECGICKREIQYLQDSLGSWDYDIEIYAVNINSDLGNWKKFIVDHNIKWTNVNGTRSVTQDFHDLYDIYGSPVIYLLDEKRNIIAKRIAAKQIPDIIDHSEKVKPE